MPHADAGRKQRRASRRPASNIMTTCPRRRWLRTHGPAIVNLPASPCGPTTFLSVRYRASTYSLIEEICVAPSTSVTIELVIARRHGTVSRCPGRRVA